MKRRSPGPRDLTDWERLRQLTDEDIAKAVAEDPDAAPLLDEEWFKRAKLVLPDPKLPVTIRLDRDVVMWFKQGGPRYQSRINAVLRAYMEAHRKPAARPGGKPVKRGRGGAPR
ncbi:MAG: BrnA antitoxin family protein [Gemmatimonadota bacterium]|nr:BrnA antitoxin family protein [Gemmatimonadota bacterium]